VRNALLLLINFLSGRFGRALMAIFVLGNCATAQTWFQLPPATTPPATTPPGRGFQGATSVYDPSTNSMLMFAGRTATGNMNDLWQLGGANGLTGTPQWTNPIANLVSGSPPVRSGHSAIYDSVRGRMTIFGGCGGGCLPVLNDTWVLSNATGVSGPPTWTQLPVSGPAARTRHIAVYDSANNRMIVFGGQNGSGSGGATFQDTWVLSNANGIGTPSWTQLNTAGGPPPGQNAPTGVYDAVNNRLIVFGGAAQGTGAFTNAVWALSNANGLGGPPTWTNIVPEGATGAPPPRALHSAIYDPASNTMTIFGGVGANSDLNDVWTLSKINTQVPIWSERSPFGFLLDPRDSHTAIYDSANNRMTIFGGSSTFVSPPRLDDTWVLTNANFSPSGPVNLVSVNPSAIAVGAPPTPLIIKGTGFTTASILLFNGVLPLTTSFVNPTQINAVTDGIFSNSPGMAGLQVENSNSLILNVLDPTISSLSPSTIGQGAPSFLLTVNGSNFNSKSLVLISSFGPLTTTLVNSNQLIAQVPASAVSSSGNLGVFVVADIFPFTGFSNTVTFVVGPPALTCNTNGGVPTERYQGSAELLGDVLLICSGGTPNQVLTSDITVFAVPLCSQDNKCTVNLTSRILNASTQATDALLLIDDPGSPQAPNTPQVLNTNVFQGILTAPNAITFRSVPIVQPGSSGNRVLRIVNLRENVHQIGQISSITPTPINVVLAFTGGVILNNPQVLTGFVAPSSFRPRVSVASLSDQRSVQVSFTEDFPTAFKTRVAAGGLQNLPGVLYNTESGFVNPALLPNAGIADSATRLMVKLTGVPNGVNVYAQVFPNGNTNAQLVATDSNGAGPASFIPGVAMFGGTYSQVPISAGSGVAVWEVTSTDPLSIETLQFRIMLTGMTQPNLGPIALVASPAPLSATNTASTSSPLPRFGTDSTTNFVNLTLTSNSVATGPGGNAVLPSTRPSEGLRPNAAAAPQVQVGSNLSFTYTLTNNGPGPAPQVIVQSNLPSTLSFVNCVTSTDGVCVSAANADGSMTVTGGYGDFVPVGHTSYLTVYAHVLQGAIGTTINVRALVSAGKTDPNPDDNFALTTFSVVDSPVMVPVTFTTSPAGLKVQAGTDVPKVNPSIMVDQAGTVNFSAPSPQSDPAGAPGKQFVFNFWNDGYLAASRFGVAPPIGGGTFSANFDTQYQIVTTASPAAGGTVSVAPSAANNFYIASAPVMLTATPAAGYTFTGFTGDVTSTANPLSTVMPAAPLNIRANFAASVFAVSPSAVQFGATPLGALVTSQQTINVQAPPGVTWSASANQNFISVSPTSGTGNGSFTIGIVTAALPTSGTASGMVILTAPNITTSPTVNVTAAISAGAKPFGSFDTPIDGTTKIAGAVPVTGWALDSIEVVKVDIWREPVTGEAAGSNGLVYIGDAVFVAGARPDVQGANPTLPFNYRGGWGYQMLTNFLPNAAGSGPSGNGVYKLHAIAHNKAGVSADLGAKTITVDNGHATLPFGTIDTPSQGGTASGSAYVNFAWALTPNPNKIPIDGSTITAVIDGQPVGHPVYNNFRSDIATLFPGYMNSGGAVGYYYLDTTKLSNGVHTISWNVFDNMNNGQGIGSRYFNVFNSGGPVAAPEEEAMEPATIDPTRPVEIEELGRVELPLSAIGGYQLSNGRHVPLPIGSSLKRGVFYWQPGPGFLGNYTLVFERQDGTQAQVHVTIRPKTYPQ
jgi:uncharacterized repeat protein (TIGR01451 family)